MERSPVSLIGSQNKQTSSGTSIIYIRRLNMPADHRTSNRYEDIPFQDWILRMYPEFRRKDGERVNGAKSVTYQVTDDCSLACKYCYQTNKGHRRMSWEVAKAFTDKLLSGESGFREYLGNPPAIVLEFIGGEPLLEINLIDRIIDYFRTKAIEMNHPWAERYGIDICSNGIAYNNKDVQRFLWKNRNDISFAISVDGTKELHDACRVFPNGAPSYDIAHSAALDWKSRGNYMGSKITIAPSNIEYLAECLKQMVLDGYKSIHANYVFEEGWTLEHARTAWQQSKIFADWMRFNKYDQAEYDITFLRYEGGDPLPEGNINNWCGGTGDMLACDPEGKLYPCVRYMESSLGTAQQPVIIGDVQRGIMQKPEERERVNRLNCITRRTQSTDECFWCPVAHGCAWCSAYNYQVHGTADKRCTFICEPHKARILATVYYWNKYYHEKGADDKVHDLWVPRQWAIPIIGEKDYEDLVSLTKSMGGYVNESATEIKNYQYPMEAS